MSIQLLLSQNDVFHTPSHDLESIFFVFIYICTNLSGPQVPRPLSELRELKSLPMAAWFNPASSMERLGSDKMASMMLFTQRILPYFAEYFHDLKPCALRLKSTIYPTPTSLVDPIVVSHDEIIQIFDEALDTLPSEPVPDQADQAIQVGLKCQLGMHDNALNFNRMNKKRKGSSASSPTVNHSSSGIRSSTRSKSLKASSGIRSSTGIRSSSIKSLKASSSKHSKQ